MVDDMGEAFLYCVIPSPVGDLLIAGNANGLKLIDFQAGPHPRIPQPGWIRSRRPFGDIIEQMNRYFAGDLVQFSVPLAPDGTVFQQRVWRALQDIPYGRTVSYGELAARIGAPRAARAVGAANGRNPLPIVIPCHRVIGKSGTLVGFGGGLAIKEALLTLEQRSVAGVNVRAASPHKSSIGFSG